MSTIGMAPALLDALDGVEKKLWRVAPCDDALSSGAVVCTANVARALGLHWCGHVENMQAQLLAHWRLWLRGAERFIVRPDLNRGMSPPCGIAGFFARGAS